MIHYDAIVIGTGGVGSAALFHLARRGLRVLGLDRFPPGHDRGSSHGQTRIIRQAYFEHPDYVPLLKRAYELWSDLEQRTGRHLYYEVGLLEVGPPDGELIRGVLHAAAVHDLPVERIAPAEFARRFPGFVLPPGHAAVFEQNAGYLLVEECVLAHLEAARQCGAEHRTGESITDWHEDDGHFVVQTTGGEYRAARLVLAGGAWASRLLPNLGVPLRVLRKHLHWYDADPQIFHHESGCTTFLFETPDHSYFYGFPAIDDRGLKVAEHSGGEVLDDPLQLDRSPDPADRQRVEQFLATYLPAVSHRPLHHDVCLYTMSPDTHFLVDHVPGHPRAAFAAGLSGHGFKFTSVLGEILADLIHSGQSPLPIEFLGLTRIQ